MKLLNLWTDAGRFLIYRANEAEDIVYANKAAGFSSAVR